MPTWLLALQIALQEAPAIVNAIELAKLPPLKPEEMAVLRASMDAAIDRLDNAIANG